MILFLQFKKNFQLLFRNLKRVENFHFELNGSSMARTFIQMPPPPMKSSSEMNAIFVAKLTAIQSFVATKYIQYVQPGDL